jgi:hypothetical protein
VPAERIYENIFGHFQALVKFLKVLVGLCLVGAELLGGNNGQGAVKIVNGFKEISSETLDRECTSSLNISLGSFLEIPEVCDRAKIFVLVDGNISTDMERGHVAQGNHFQRVDPQNVKSDIYTFKSITSLFLASSSFFNAFSVLSAASV